MQNFHSFFKRQWCQKIELDSAKNNITFPFSKLFFHSQWLNPSPSAVNPIFPAPKRANTRSHFMPSRPSTKYAQFNFLGDF